MTFQRSLWCGGHHLEWLVFPTFHEDKQPESAFEGGSRRPVRVMACLLR